MTIDRNKYPEFAKVADIPECEKQLLGSFIEHLEGEVGIQMVELKPHNNTHFYSTGKHFNIEELIASYYEIDYEKYLEQKEAAIEEALEGQRKLNNAHMG